MTRALLPSALAVALAGAAAASCSSGKGTTAAPPSGEDVSCGAGMFISQGMCRALPPIGSGAGAAGNDAADDAGAFDASSLEGGDAGEAGDAPGPDLASASGYLVNPSHSGFVSDSTLTPPLVRLWDALLGGPVSYPVVAGGLVFVTTSAIASTNATLFALDDASGRVVWSADLGPAQYANLAYDQGVVFEVDASMTGAARPRVRAFDAETGRLVWTMPTDAKQTLFDGPPAAYRGILYLYGSGSGATLYAYDEGTGGVLWTHPASGSWGSPAVSDEGVFLSEPCGAALALDRATGATLWQNMGQPCGQSDDGGTAPVVYDGVLYVRDPTFGDSRLSVSTGVSVGRFTADAPPAFGPGLGVYVSSGALFGSDETLGASTWSFAPLGAVTTAPVIDGNDVYVESSMGILFAVDVRSAAVVWSVHVATPIVFREELPAGMAAAHGVLVVPDGSDVVAYVSGPADAAVAADALAAADGTL